MFIYINTLDEKNKFLELDIIIKEIKDKYQINKGVSLNKPTFIFQGKTFEDKSSIIDNFIQENLNIWFENTSKSICQFIIKTICGKEVIQNFFFENKNSNSKKIYLFMNKDQLIKEKNTRKFYLCRL